MPNGDLLPRGSGGTGSVGKIEGAGVDCFIPTPPTKSTVPTKLLDEASCHNTTY